MCVNVTSSDSLAAEGHVCFVTEARYVSPFHSCTWWDGSVSQPPVSQHTHTHLCCVCSLQLPVKLSLAQLSPG